MSALLSHLPPLAALAGLLPLAALPLGVLAALARERPGRAADAIVRVSLAWGAGLWAASELLGLASALRPPALLAGWIAADAALLAWLVRRRRHLRAALRALRPPAWAWALLPLLAATAATAVLLPPNTWDSMCYHLSRVEFWLQQGSLAFHPTAEPRQLFSQPFAEIAVLHVHALAGGDWLDGLVQWTAHAGCIALACDLARIATRGNRTASALAAFFAATLPIALLEASTCQNDLVVSFWILAAAKILLSLRALRPATGLPALGAAAGLAVLAKGSADPILLPFAAGAAAFVLRAPRRRAAWALLALALALLPNAPHWARTTRGFGDPFGGQAATFRPPARASALAATAWCGLASDLYPFSPAGTRRATEAVLGALGVDPADRRVFFPGCDPRKLPRRPFHRDTAPNPLHAALLLAAAAAAPALLRSGRRTWRADRLAALAALCALACAAFVLCIRWQTWITRLQTPLFLLCAAPFAAVASLAGRRTAAALCAALALAALPAAFCSEERTLLPCPWEGRCTIRNSPREHLYFAGRRGEYGRYADAADRIAAARPDALVIVGSDGAWDYPVFPMLRARLGRDLPRIRHMGEGEAAGEEAVLRISADRPRTSLRLAAEEGRAP